MNRVTFQPMARAKDNTPRTIRDIADQLERVREELLTVQRSLEKHEEPEADIPRVFTSPITLPCPRCQAQPGDVCEVLGRRLKIIHVERIQAALAQDRRKR